MTELIALVYLMLASLIGLGLALWRESWFGLSIHSGTVVAVLALL